MLREDAPGLAEAFESIHGKAVDKHNRKFTVAESTRKPKQRSLV
eukprot:COSAG05_NODE_19737_length_288_cov_1.005291_1_plen_43_part_10